MLTSFHATAARVLDRATGLAGCAALVAAVALGGCAGQVGPTLTAADLRQDSSLASWQVAGPTVASEARSSDQQQCYGGASRLVDDCDPMSVRYDGP